MSNIPKGVVEEVKSWNLPKDEEKNCLEDYEAYFTYRKEQIRYKNKELLNKCLFRRVSQ